MRGAVPDHCNSQTLCWSASSLPNNELYWHCLLNVNSLKFLDKILQEGPRGSSLGTAPLSRLPDVTHVTLSPRPSPSVFAYCKQSKTGGGNEATDHLMEELHVWISYLLPSVGVPWNNLHQNFSWAYIPLCLGKIEERKDLTWADLSCSPLLCSGPLLFYPSLSSCRLW